MIKNILNKTDKSKEISKKIYIDIINSSNEIVNDPKLTLEKNYSVSFEIVCLLIIIFLKVSNNKKIINYSSINQNLIDTFVNDLDESLREKGIGDMSIGKYVKAYVKKFYYRLSKFHDLSINNKNNYLKAYLENLDFTNDNDLEKLINKLIIFEKKLVKDIGSLIY